MYYTNNLAYQKLRNYLKEESELHEQIYYLKCIGNKESLKYYAISTSQINAQKEKYIAKKMPYLFVFCDYH